MLKAKTGNKTHRSRTVDDAIREVKKEDLTQFSFYLPKSHRLKFRRKAEDKGLSAAEELRAYIARYIED